MWWGQGVFGVGWWWWWATMLTAKHHASRPLDDHLGVVGDLFGEGLQCFRHLGKGGGTRLCSTLSKLEVWSEHRHDKPCHSKGSPKWP